MNCTRCGRPIIRQRGDALVYFVRRIEIQKSGLVHFVCAQCTEPNVMTPDAAERIRKALILRIGEAECPSPSSP